MNSKMVFKVKMSQFVQLWGLNWNVFPEFEFVISSEWLNENTWNLATIYESIYWWDDWWQRD